MNAESIGQLKSGHTELDEFFNSINIGGRRYRFQPMAEAMIKAGRPMFILETGCMRKPLHGPEADGCSSLVWDYVAKQTGGYFVSVDVNQENINYARSKLSDKAQLFCLDSVSFLSGVSFITQPIDLLYLDSMDWEGGVVQRNLSALHHAAELSAAWKWIRPGGLIAVDDCMDEYAGKHALVKRFFDAIGVQPITDDYIHVWRKPSLQVVPTNEGIEREIQETQP